MKKVVIKYKQLLLSITIAVLLLFLLLFVTKKPFVFSQDQWLQYKYFYEEWIRLIEDFFSNGNLPFYSWNNFLGTDFFSSKGYYVTGDILIGFYFLFKNIDVFLTFETIACLFISAITMYMFLEEFGIKNKKIINISSICYALSGFAVLYMGQYMFHRFYTILPLLFYGVEKYLRSCNGIAFVLSVALLFIQNYYLMFPTTIMMAFYIMFSIFYNKKKKYCIRIVFSLVGYYLIGFIISGIISFPSIAYILNNNRLGKHDFSKLFMQYQTYIGLATNWVSHYPDALLGKNIFTADYNGHLSYYSLFFGGFPFFGTISLYIKEKNKSYLWLLVTILFLLISPLNSIIHGFSVNSLRWTFTYVLFAILLSAIFFDKYNDYRIVTKSAIYYYVLDIILIMIGIVFGYVSFQEHKLHLLCIFIFIICSIIQVVIYQKNTKYIFISIYSLLILSMLFNVMALSRDGYYYEESLDNEVINYIQDIDEDLLYRYYVNHNLLLPSSDINLNQSMHYNFMSTSTYDTTYDNTINDFLRKAGYDLHIVEINNYNINRMLGTKYYIVSDKSQLPNNDFEFVTNINNLEVYKDNNYRGFAYTYGNFTNFNNVDMANFEWDKLIVDDIGSFEEYKNNEQSQKLKIDIKTRNYILGHIDIDSNSVLFVPIPANDGWKVYDNGMQIDIYNVNGGFIGLKLTKGYHEISMNFISPMFKEGLVMSAIGVISLIVIIVKNSKINKEKDWQI